MFRRSYEIAQDLGNPVVTEDARIKLGIATAHHVLSGFCSTMNDVNKPNLQKILDFKSARTDTFFGDEEPQPDEGPSSQTEVLQELSMQENISEELVAENGAPADETDAVDDADQQPKESETEEIETTDKTEKDLSDAGVTSEHEDNKESS